MDAKLMALPLIADLLLLSEIAEHVGTGNGDLAMFHDQMINFLEAAVVFLLLTNMVSALMATCAMRLLNQSAGITRGPASIERKLNAMLGVGA
jgi:hypothetical protein